MVLPTKTEINKAKQYLEDEGTEAIDVIFCKNSKLSIYEKIYALDKIYSCNLNLTEKGFRKLAEELKVKKTVKEIADLKLQELDPNYKGRRRTVGYVFASKYCYFNGPEEGFVIYDKYADMAVNYLNNGETKCIYKNNYASYVEEVKNMHSNSFSYRELDKYLWLLGQVLEAVEMKGKKKQYQSRISYIQCKYNSELEEIKETLLAK